MDSRRFTVSFCIHSHCPQKFFRHYQTEVTTRSSLKEELLFKDAGQYSRGHKSRGQHTPLQGKVQKVHSLEWKNGPCFYSCHNPEAALRKKKKNLKNKHIQKEQCECSEGIKTCEQNQNSSHVQKKIDSVPSNNAKRFKRNPCLFL